MAKPIIKFTAVPYQIGNGETTYTGYRPQLESQQPLSDLAFCQEVVTEKRLSMSADELLHAMEMVGEVGPAKVATDGRPRAITKLIKFDRKARGRLESPTDSWNDSCKARINVQLLWDAEKYVDATFRNVNEGIGVRLNYVAWIGAQAVTNVVKVGKQFVAYGNHMEWLTGDTATLIVGETPYALTCTESDVAHAVFNWPAGLNPEEGTVATFVMKSRGGVAEGEVYTSKKDVTILANDDPFLITKTTSASGENKLKAFENFVAHGSGFFDILRVQIGCADENGDVSWMNQEVASIASDGKSINLTGGEFPPMWVLTNPGKLKVIKTGGTEVNLDNITLLSA